MAQDKKQDKKERKPVKIGTHGRTSGGWGNKPRTQAAEYVPPKETLKDKDPAQWKAQKAVKKKNKDSERAAAKKHGHRMGRWESGGAACKNKGCEAIIRLSEFEGPDSARDATKMTCGGG